MCILFVRFIDDSLLVFLIVETIHLFHTSNDSLYIEVKTTIYK